MPVINPLYGADETVQRAEDIYNQSIRPLVEAHHKGRYIAIDVDTSEYEIGDDYHTAAHIVLSRRPGASVAVLRIGYPAVGRIGGRVRPARS
jgi:hypothetical protein